MATSQDLVPTGQPFGDRQRNVAAMELANVPLSSQGGPVAPPVGGGGPQPAPVLPGPGAVPPAAAPDLSGFDVFSGREATPRGPGVPVPAQQGSRFRAGAATTQNQVMIDTLKHVDRYLEG